MPFSPRKMKSIFILTTLLWTGFTPDSFSAEKTTFQGFFPMPFVSIDQFILKPRSALSMAICEIGTIYVDASTGELIVCGQSNSKSKRLWEQNLNFVFPANPAPDLKVSIGNDSNPVPPATFNILGPIVAGEQNEFNIDPLNGINSAGITLKMDGAFIAGPPALNTSDDINFHAGNQGQDYDGRILYMNQPRQGFAFYGAYNMMNMWVNKLTHRVGIGTVNPLSRLDIIGDIETNKIILDQDGTLGADPPADLKVTYSPSAGGGYYAVYAP